MFLETLSIFSHITRIIFKITFFYYPYQSLCHTLIVYMMDRPVGPCAVKVTENS